MFKLVVLSCVLAIAAAAPSGLLGIGGLGHAGLGLGLLGPAGLGLGPAGLGLSHAGLGLGHAGLVAPLGAGLLAGHGGVALGAPAIAAYNYRGPLSLHPGQPANIVAADGRPLDTLSVNLDRAAHLTARAVDGAGLHLLHKRSAPLLGAPLGLPHAGLPGRLIAPSPLGLGPLGVPGHVGVAGVPLSVPGAHLGLGAPLGLGPWGGVGHLGLGHLG